MVAVLSTAVSSWSRIRHLYLRAILAATVQPTLYRVNGRRGDSYRTGSCQPACLSCKNVRWSVRCCSTNSRKSSYSCSGLCAAAAGSACFAPDVLFLSGLTELGGDPLPGFEDAGGRRHLRCQLSGPQAHPLWLTVPLLEKTAATCHRLGGESIPAAPAPIASNPSRTQGSSCTVRHIFPPHPRSGRLICPQRSHSLYRHRVLLYNPAMLHMQNRAGG